MSARAQQSFTRPVSQAIAEGATTPNAGAAGAVALSSTTGGFMRWTGSAWTSASGAVHTSRVLVNFGHATGGEDTICTTTVTASWVTTSSTIVCHPATTTTADHGAYDAAAEGIWAYATNVVAATSFDIITVAPLGTWGRYYIDAVAY